MNIYEDITDLKIAGRSVSGGTGRPPGAARTTLFYTMQQRDLKEPIERALGKLSYKIVDAVRQQRYISVAQQRDYQTEGLFTYW